MSASAFRTFVRLVRRDNYFTALIAVICRNPVTPPDLPGDTPVMNILKPVQICSVKALRHKLQLAFIDRRDGGLGQFIHPDKPLLFDHRLNRRMTAVMCSDRMDMLLYLDQIAALFQVFDNLFTRFITVHTGIFSAVFIDGRIII